MKEKIFKLRSEGKTYNEISKLLNCSKSTISYHCKNFTENEKIILNNSKERYENYRNYEEINENEHKVIIELFEKGYKIIDISNKLNLSRYKINKHLKIHDKKRHNKEITIEERKVLKKLYIKKWRRSLKKQCVDYKGGKCKRCGYDKYPEVLDFHHRDPIEKDFQISDKGWSFERLKKELDKCDLVCKNCHEEIHIELRKMNKKDID